MQVTCIKISVEHRMPNAAYTQTLAVAWAEQQELCTVEYVGLRTEKAQSGGSPCYTLYVHLHMPREFDTYAECEEFANEVGADFDDYVNAH